MNPSERIDQLIAGLTDWRGKTLAGIRKSIVKADREIIEEWKWMGSPAWSRDGIIAVANAHKDKVKLTFAHGASLPDTDKLFNAGLGGNAWPRGSVQKRPTGVISKPANGSGAELLEVVPDRELSKQGKSVFFLKASKKTHSEVRSRVFSRSPMVLGHGFSGAEGSVCNFVLQLRGPHLRIWPWCRRRSSMAVTAALSPSSFPQSSIGRFEVTNVLVRS